MRCVIFCAGDMDALLEPVRPEDVIIAADGGLLHTQRLGLAPHHILGDFDSLGYVPEKAKRHPVEKDDTDTMLAVRLGLELGCWDFLFYGSLDGPRLDHTVANFQTLRFLADHGASGTLVGKGQLVTLLKDGTLVFPGAPRGTVSAFAQGGIARGVTLRGLKYPLEEGCLDCGFPLGVSNAFTGQSASVTVKNGCLLLIWDRACGLPERRHHADL